MSLSVHKFGGTSVGSAAAIRRSLALIEDAAEQGACLAVVSACAGSTDRLVELSAAPANRRSSLSGELLRSHLQLAAELLDGERLLRLNLRLHEYFSQLQRQVEHLPEASAKAWIFGLGEYLSSAILHEILLARGRRCRLLDGRRLVFGQGQPLEIEPHDPTIRKALAVELLPYLQAKGDLALTQGFVASDLEGRPALLGRGGSDFTAGLLAAHASAQSLVIWTDTPGVLSADPRKVAGSFTQSRLSWQEARILARLGAKVLHPRAVDHPAQAGIPVWVKSSFEPQAPGTLVHGDAARHGARVRSLTYKSHCVLLHLPGQPDGERLAAWMPLLQVSDALSINHEGISAVLPSASWQAWWSQFPDKSAPVQVEEGFSLLSLVGRRLNEVNSLAAELLRTLSHARFRPRIVGVSPQGFSFSLLVAGKWQDQALVLLHELLFQKLARARLRQVHDQRRDPTPFLNSISCSNVTLEAPNAGVPG